MDELVDILHNGGHSLVIRNGNTVRTFDGHGVSDLYHLLMEEPETLYMAIVADKVVGKGAAALIVLGGVKNVYAGIVSESALQLLRKHGIMVSFLKKVPYVINRQGNGVCPVESLCRDCVTANECLPLIKDFITGKI